MAALLIERSRRSVLVDGDQFFGFLAQGAIEPWLPESSHQNEIVTEAAGMAAGRFARDLDTVYEGVIGPWFLSTFAAATGLDELDYVILLPSVQICVARVRGRSGHGFSDENATRKMHAEFESAGIHDRHVLRAESADPADTVTAIQTARVDGQLRHTVHTR